MRAQLGGGCAGCGKNQVEDRARLPLEVGRAVALAGLDALQEQPVEQRDVATRGRVDVEPGREFATRDALAQQHLARAHEALAPPGEHLADARFALGDGPRLDERHEPGPALGRPVDRVDVEAHGGLEPLRGGRLAGDHVAERLEAAAGHHVAAREEQLFLALEVGVDRTDRQAAVAHDVLDRGAVPALGEDAHGGTDDPLADFLFVLRR